MKKILLLPLILMTVVSTAQVKPAAAKKSAAATTLSENKKNDTELKSVSYTENGQKLNGFTAIPAKPGKIKAGILILPAWFGINGHAKEVANKLSKKGVYTFIADIYGEGKYPADAKQAAEQSGYYKKNPEKYVKRIQAALSELVKLGADPNNIVIIGYCFGGTGALEAARSGINVKGVVSFHGGLGKDPSRKNGEIKPRVLVLHGADDPYVPQSEVEAFITEMKEGKADWQLNYYSGAVHGFTEKESGSDSSKGAAYSPEADRRSWDAFQDFLKETFAHKSRVKAEKK